MLIIKKMGQTKIRPDPFKQVGDTSLVQNSVNGSLFSSHTKKIRACLQASPLLQRPEMLPATGSETLYTAAGTRAVA